jgi:hypothetical protein
MQQNRAFCRRSLDLNGENGSKAISTSVASRKRRRCRALLRARASSALIELFDMFASDE